MKTKADNRAFTLIEIMIVITIMAITMAVGVPYIVHNLRDQPLQTSIQNIAEACRHARAFAILKATPSEVVIREDGTVFVEQVSAGRRPLPGEMAIADLTRRLSEDTGSRIFSTQISPEVSPELLDVNFIDHMQEAEARVRFQPNGTSDEFTVVLFRPETSKRMILTLEMVTGAPDISEL